MCPPVPILAPLAGAGAASWIIPAALSAAGAAYNASTQRKAVEAQNKQNQISMEMAAAAREAERARQQDQFDRQLANVSEALTNVDPARLETDAQTAAATAGDFVPSADVYNMGELQGQTTTGEMSDTIGKMIEDKVNETKGMLYAQEFLAGQDALMQGFQDDTVRLASENDFINSLRRGSLNVGRMEADISPAKVTPSDSILGDALLLGGTLAGGMLGKSAVGAAGAAGGPAAMTSAGLPSFPGFGANWWQHPY